MKHAVLSAAGAYMNLTRSRITILYLLLIRPRTQGEYESWNRVSPEERHFV